MKNYSLKNIKVNIRRIFSRVIPRRFIYIHLTEKKSGLVRHVPREKEINSLDDAVSFVTEGMDEDRLKYCVKTIQYRKEKLDNIYINGKLNGEINFVKFKDSDGFYYKELVIEMPKPVPESLYL